MFCPKCNAEYRPGFTQCADCHVALMDKSVEQPHQAVARDTPLSGLTRTLLKLRQWLEEKTNMTQRIQWLLTKTGIKDSFASRWFGFRVLGYSYLLMVVYSFAWGFASQGLYGEEKDAFFRHSSFLVLHPLIGLLANGSIVLYIIHVVCHRHQGVKRLVLGLLVVPAYMILIFITAIAVCGIGD